MPRRMQLSHGYALEFPFFHFEEFICVRAKPRFFMQFVGDFTQCGFTIHLVFTVYSELNVSKTISAWI